MQNSLFKTNESNRRTHKKVRNVIKKLISMEEELSVLKAEYDKCHKDPSQYSKEFIAENLIISTSSISLFPSMSETNRLWLKFKLTSDYIDDVKRIVLGSPEGSALKFAEDKRADLFDKYKNLEIEKISLENKMRGFNKYLLPKEQLEESASKIALIDAMQEKIIRDDKKIEMYECRVFEYYCPSVEPCPEPHHRPVSSNRFDIQPEGMRCVIL